MFLLKFKPNHFGMSGNSSITDFGIVRNEIQSKITFSSISIPDSIQFQTKLIQFSFEPILKLKILKFILKKITLIFYIEIL